MTKNIDLSSFEMIDNHAHSFLKDHLNLSEIQFRSCFTETSNKQLLEKHIPHSVNYQLLVKAIKLEFEVDSITQFLEQRKSLFDFEHVKSLFDKAKLKSLIIDDGFNSKSMLPLDELSSICGRPVYRVLRIETELEKLLLRFDSLDEILKKFENIVKGADLVGLKTIAAYRGGLEIGDIKKEKAKESLDFARWMAKEKKTEASCRLNGEDHHHYLLKKVFEFAAKLDLPVQVHCGFGDSDLELHKANPALLTSSLKEEKLKDLKLVLLHCYPFVRRS